MIGNFCNGEKGLAPTQIDIMAVPAVGALPSLAGLVETAQGVLCLRVLGARARDGSKREIKLADSLLQPKPGAAMFRQSAVKSLFCRAVSPLPRGGLLVMSAPK